MRTSLVIFLTTFVAGAFASVAADVIPSVSFSEVSASAEVVSARRADSTTSSPIRLESGAPQFTEIPSELPLTPYRITTLSVPLPILTTTLPYSGFFARQTGADEASEVAATAIDTKKGTPVQVSIPSAGINSEIVGVGLTNSGKMAVPEGGTNNVGWYKNGTLPGNTGSAVLDAHVFAAFSNLKNVVAGDSIFITTEGGQTLRFVVESTRVYKLSELSADQLFNKKDARRLNLITCAGELTADKSTYTHRLVVYAKYAGIA